MSASPGADEPREATVHVDLTGLREFRMFVWQVREVMESIEADLVDFEPEDRDRVQGYRDGIDAAIRRFVGSRRDT